MVDAVEQERDSRERLHRPVVQEEREPPALVLLGRDQLIGQPLALRLPLGGVLQEPPLAQGQVPRDRRRHERQDCERGDGDGQGGP